jgi:hypothetical protein
MRLLSEAAALAGLITKLAITAAVLWMFVVWFSEFSPRDIWIFFPLVLGASFLLPFLFAWWAQGEIHWGITWLQIGWAISALVFIVLSNIVNSLDLKASQRRSTETDNHFEEW